MACHWLLLGVIVCIVYYYRSVSQDTVDLVADCTWECVRDVTVTATHPSVTPRQDSVGCVPYIRYIYYTTCKCIHYILYCIYITELPAQHRRRAL